MRRAFRRRTGLAFFETALTVALFASLTVGLGIAVDSTIRLSERSRAVVTSSQENRVSLERMANALRGAASTTLTGFGAGGVATTLNFQTTTGMTAGAQTLSSVATLQWLPTPTSVRGVTSPGEVVLVRDGVPRRIAARVPSGGFTVTRSGDSLLIHVKTFTSTTKGDPSYATGDALVRLRN